MKLPAVSQRMKSYLPVLHRDKGRDMKEKIKDFSLHSRIAQPADAASLIRPNSTVAMSGYAMAGYPKVITRELVLRQEAGEELELHLLTGANVPYLDEMLSVGNLIKRRTPMCAARPLAALINQRRVDYTEQQMCKMPRLLRSGRLGKIDVAVVEALAIEADGQLIPTTSSGYAQAFLDEAKKVIVEINNVHPEVLMKLHDIYIPAVPPNTQPIPLTRVNQRIGRKYLQVDPGKIVSIVAGNERERIEAVWQRNSIYEQMVGYLFNFLELEYGKVLPPVQIGFGGLADSIINAFRAAPFQNLEFFCGGVGEGIMELLYFGKAVSVSTAGVALTEGTEHIMEAMKGLEDALVLRNGDVINSSETIGRLGVLALNTGIEADIYGNINSSHIGGSRVVNGIGGGADFARNAGLSVVLLPALRASGTISNIVPMVAHQDIGEHDVDVLITENGVADLRGLSDCQRAEQIIHCCTTGEYQEQLKFYLDKAKQECGGHHPQLPEEAFAWYRRLKEKGSMLMI